MSLGTLVTIKGTNPGYLTALLCAFTFQGETTPTLLVSTHPFNAAEGGPAFPGIGILPAGNYLARVQQQDIGALQARSSLGVDRVTDITIHLADPDHYIWNNFATTDAYGFRGASCTMGLVMWQPGTTNFSTDSAIMFVGTCDQESFTSGGNVISVHCNNGHNTATIKLSQFPLQNRCPHAFPSTPAQRLDGANNPASIYYACGYNPDQGSTNLCGNTGPANHVDGYGNQITDANGIFVSCDYVRSNANDATSGCMARLGNSSTTSVAPDGDLMHDKSGRATGRFAGIQWSPGTYYAIDTQYTTSQKIATFSFQNSNILGQYLNLLYGTQWVNAQLANVIEDGNATRCEAMICLGDIGGYGIQLVTMNGVQIPWYSNLSAGFAASGVDALFRWNFTTTGGRNGNATADAGYNVSGQYSALGDTYGSIACIEVVAYNQIFTGYGLPQVNILASGPQLYVYTSQTVSSLQGAPYNYNPAWVLLDLLVKANWTVAEINMASFIAAATVCSTSVTYINQTGASSSHERYRCMFCLQQRRTAGEVIAGVLRAFNGYLYWDQSGLLNLGINQTLADSQPSVISGSNYNTAVPSITAANTDANGYVAWSFSEADVIRKSDGTPDLDEISNATVQTPNQIVIPFQDSDNQWQTDSLTLNDPEAIVVSAGALNPGGNVIPETINCIGISNFDQATRIGNVYLAERQRGNEADDPRGTRIFRFSTDVRIEHLRVGHYVLFSWQTLEITNQLFRVQSIETTTDGQSWKVTISWVNEVWYTDAYGQAPQAFYSETNRNQSSLAPDPWQPDLVAPNSSTWSDTEMTFSLAEIDTQLSDGTTEVQMKLTGNYPMNQVSSLVGPPLVPVQASTSSTGGTIPGGVVMYMQLCAVDSSGNYSAKSKPIMCAIPPGTNTNTVTIASLGWQHGTSGYDLFASTNLLQTTHQHNASGTPTSITITSLPNTLAYAPPDLSAGSFFAQAKTVTFPGVINTSVVSVSSTGVVLKGTGSLTNNLTGYKLILVGRNGLDGTALPFIDFDITSNSGYTLTLDRNPSSLLGAGDQVVVSTRANVASSTTIGDANFVNALNTAGLTSAVVGSTVRIIAGTGRYQIGTIASVTTTTCTMTQPWAVTPDATSWFIIEEPSWRFTSKTVQIKSEKSYNQGFTTNVNCSNYKGQCILVQGVIGNPTANLLSNQNYSPFRLLYLTGAQLGNSSPSGTPAITSATAVVNYEQIGNGSKLTISGVITLPTTSPYYANLGTISVYYNNGLDSVQTLMTTLQGPWTGSTVNYTSGALDIPTSAETWTISFIGKSSTNGVESTPYSTTVSVSPLSGAFVGCGDASALSVSSPNYVARVADSNGDAHFQVWMELTCTTYPMVVSIYWYANAENEQGEESQGWILMGAINITAADQVVFSPQLTGSSKNAGAVPGYFVPNDTSQTWQLALIPATGTTFVNNPVFAYTGTGPTYGLPSNAILSSTFTVAESAAIAANVITAAFVNNSSGSPIDYQLVSPGQYYWFYHEIVLTLPASNPYLFDILVYVQAVDAVTGAALTSNNATWQATNPVTNGTGQIIYVQEAMTGNGGPGTITIPGTFMAGMAGIGWTIPPAGSSPAGNNVAFNFSIQAVSRLGTTPQGGAGTSTVQTSAWSTGTYYKLQPTIPAAKLDLTQALPSSLDPAGSLVKNAEGQILVGTVPASGVPTVNVQAVANGTPTFSGTLEFQNTSSGAYVEVGSAGATFSGGTSSPAIVTLTPSQLTLGSTTTGQPQVKITSSSMVLQGVSTGETVTLNSSGIVMNTGSYYATFASTGMLFSYGGSTTTSYPNVYISSANVYVSASATNYVEITGTGASLVSGSQSIVMSASSGITLQGGSESITIISGSYSTIINGGTVSANAGSFNTLGCDGLTMPSGSITIGSGASTTTINNSSITVNGSWGINSSGTLYGTQIQINASGSIFSGYTGQIKVSTTTSGGYYLFSTGVNYMDVHAGIICTS